jgi:hypothetical protein
MPRPLKVMQVALRVRGLGMSGALKNHEIQPFIGPYCFNRQGQERL